MHFVYPAFLFALVALIIPVLVHLFHFRRFQKVYFSNVQFLKEIQEQQSSRRNIRERLILASRLLSLAFLIFAFARPFIPNQKTAVKPGQQRAVSIFVDNSYSMQALSREGTLLDEAKTRAKEIASAYDINTRFQVLTQDFEGKHQRFINRDGFNDAVDAIRISAQSRSLQHIINRQQSLLETRPAAVKSAYILSDFQRNLGGDHIAADTATAIRFVQIKANTLPNIAVDSVWLLSAVHRPGENEKLVIKLHNYADAKAINVPLKLVINRAQKALGSYTLNAGSVLTDTLAFSGLQDGWQQAEIQLQDNPVTFDNHFYFNFYVEQQMPVLLVNGGTPDTYLKTVFSSDPFFKITETTDGHVDYNGISKYSLVVLSNIRAISTGLSQQLKTYVEKGGSLAVFPSAEIDAASYRNLLQPLEAAFPEKIIKQDTKVSSVNLQSQLYSNTFESMPQNPDLPVVKSYYQFNNSLVAAGEKLMSISGAGPFLERFKHHGGSVYVSAVPLDEAFSNFPRHALFVTTMLRIAMLSGHDQPLYYKLGNNQSVEVADITTRPDDVLTLTSGEQKIIPDVRRNDGSTRLFISDQLSKPGHYALKSGNEVVQWFSFNNNASESDLHYLTAAQLQQLLSKQRNTVLAEQAPLKTIISQTNFGLQLWKLCLLLALVFLLAEILLVRFYKPYKTGSVQPPDIINTGTNQHS